MIRASGLDVYIKYLFEGIVNVRKRVTTVAVIPCDEMGSGTE
jgi:hypothetical protein